MAAAPFSTTTVHLDAQAVVAAMPREASARKVRLALLKVGVAALNLATTAVVATPRIDGRQQPAYILGVGGAYMAGTVAIWAAFWVDAPARRRKGQFMLGACLVALAISAVMAGFAITFEN